MEEVLLIECLLRHEKWLESYGRDPGSTSGAPLTLEAEKIMGVRLSNREFCHAELSGCEFNSCKFDACDFSNTRLVSALLRDCAFVHCKFVKSDLRGATAEGANFAGSDFTRADLTDARLQTSRLTNCVLDWSWLVRTDLRFTFLNGVRLENARLFRTKLYNDKNFPFVMPVRITAQELDFSPAGDGSILIGAEGLQQLLGDA